MKEYQAEFLEDALDLLADIEKTLLELENSPEQESLVEEVFRIMHTIKGAANMFGLEAIGNLTHQIENIYDAIRSKQYRITEEVLTLTLQAVDHLRNLLNDRSFKNPVNKETHKRIEGQIGKLLSTLQLGEPTFLIQKKEYTNRITYYLILKPLSFIDPDDSTTAYLFSELEELGNCKITEHKRGNRPNNKGEEGDFFGYWDIYLATDQGKEAIEGLFLFVDDQFTVEIFEVAVIDLLEREEFHEKIDELEEKGEILELESLQAYVNELLEIIRLKEVKLLDTDTESASEDIISTKKPNTLKVSREKVDKMMNWVSELVMMQGALKMLAQNNKIAELSAVAEKIDLITGGLRNTVFSISLVPVEVLMTHFSRLIRDLSKSLGKEVTFSMQGKDTELDKKIIDQLTEPLLHILRNSLDHGLETPEERRKAGKPPQGQIVLKAFYSGRHVVIQLEDDGRGIDVERIRKKAEEKGLISRDESLSEQEILQLIFAPGFSTAENVTDVSGRGVGMDVVKQKVNEVKGTVAIQSEIGKGTTLSLKLPLTLSIVEGLLVQTGELTLAIPMAAVHQCYRVKATEVTEAKRFNAAITVEGKQLPALNLRETFGILSAVPATYILVSVIYQGQEFALIVDKVIDQQQLVLKPLGAMYQQHDFLSGASILGDGSLALILDVEQLLSRFKTVSLP